MRNWPSYELISKEIIVSRENITQHEGKKYLKTIYPATGEFPAIDIDVYCVLKAFDVTCPATAHAIKKLLCAGMRGKGDRKADLIGAMSALNRAIDMAEGRQHQKVSSSH
jgi:hypothetical protein